MTRGTASNRRWRGAGTCGTQLLLLVLVLVLLPDAEVEEEVGVVMTAALESMASMYLGGQSTAAATEAAAADVEKPGALMSLALFVCRSGLRDGQSYSARVKGREARAQPGGRAKVGCQKWIPAARVTQPDCEQ